MNDNSLFLNHSLKILQSSFSFKNIDHQLLKSIIKNFTHIKWKRGKSIDSDIAMDDITAIKTPLHKAREIIKEYPQFNKNFLPYLGKRLRELEDFSESLVFDNTVTRLSKLILKHVIPKKDKDDKHYPLELINDLSHEAISELIGSVRSVVSTQIKQLEKEGTIVTKRGYLAVKNLKELMKKCDIFEE